MTDEHTARTLQKWRPVINMAFLAVTAVATAVLAIKTLDIGWKLGAVMASGIYLSVITYYAGKMQGAREGYTEAKIEELEETLYD